MLMTRLALVGLVVSGLLGCGADDGSTGEAGGACRTMGDLRLVLTGAADEEGGDLIGLTKDGQVRRLTDDGGSYGPSFSPDGSRIVFSSIGDEGHLSDTTGPSGLDLYVMAADGSGRRRLLDGNEDVSPAWSPGGDQIAFVRGGGSTGLVASSSSPPTAKDLTVCSSNTPASGTTPIPPGRRTGRNWRSFGPSQRGCLS